MNVTTREFPDFSPPESVRGRDLMTSLLGLVALGGAAALGAADGSMAARLVPSVVFVDLAALALTAPALIAVHQFMQLAAEPEALAGALGRALVHGGRVAGGMAIVVLFFAATTDLAVPTMVASLVAVGVFSCATACADLSRVERTATADGVVAPMFRLILVAWVALGWIIALRVGVDVTQWVEAV